MSATLMTLCLFILLLFLIPENSHSCSCHHSHPQEHYCFADFVALVHVGKAVSFSDGKRISYQIRVKKVFKANPKARIALRHGLLWTSKFASTCGRNFEPNTDFLITGIVNGEKAWVSMCNFVQEWSTLSQKQRKGFRKLYSLGCQCKVKLPYQVTNTLPVNQQKNHFCSWTTAWDGHRDCESIHSLCVPQIIDSQQRCEWLTSREFRFCLKTRKKADDQDREIEDTLP